MKTRGVSVVGRTASSRRMVRSQALVDALASLEGGTGQPCPRCPLGLVGEEGARCTSFVPDPLQGGWTGHESRGAPCFPFVAVSPPMRSLEETARRVAASDATVLITGESGTGKEVLARYIHRSGGRARAPFVRVNCAALPDHLLESELFGYEKGAFTGAESRKPGRFEMAQGGVLLLDEISEMSLALQAKLLHALEAKTFHRLGGVEEIRVDTQIIVVTNRDLEDEVHARRFRRDLYFRLKVIDLRVPPLRDRREDVPVLVDYFLCRFSRQYAQVSPLLSPSALAVLESSPWEGNVRELENLIRRLVILGEESPVLEEFFRGELRLSAVADGGDGARPAGGFVGPRGSLDLKSAARHAAQEAERDAILAALNQTRWNRTKAARLLGVSYKTLLTKMKELLPPGPEPA